MKSTLLKTSEYVEGVVTTIVLQKVFLTFWASLPSSVKPEMFGNRFEPGFSGDAFRPQRVTVRTDCQDIVRLDVTYERQPMSHDMAPRLPRELRQQQWQQQYVRTAAAAAAARQRRRQQQQQQQRGN